MQIAIQCRAFSIDSLLPMSKTRCGFIAALVKSTVFLVPPVTGKGVSKTNVASDLQTLVLVLGR